MHKPFDIQMKECINMKLLDMKQGDFTGDGVIDSIYLYGKMEDDNSLFAKEIRMLIRDGCTGQVTVIKLEDAAGYNAQLFLSDFTGNQVLDIYIGMDTGGSGGYGLYYIYSFNDFVLKKIFDSNDYQQEQFIATYEDCFQMKVENKTLNITFIIDLSSKDKSYLTQLYDEDGKLRNPTRGDVLAIGNVQPIWDEQMNLLAMSRIIGLYNADSMGYLTNYLVWNGERFVSQRLGFTIINM